MSSTYLQVNFFELLYNYFSAYAIPGPVIFSEGEKVEHQSMINDFTINNKLTLMCASINESDMVKWEVFNQTGTVLTNIYIQCFFNNNNTFYKCE